VNDHSPLPYAGPEAPRPKTHSVFGWLSAAWPVLIVAYCGNVFGKAGWVLLILGPAMCLAAVVEAAVRRRRLLLPLLSLAACVVLFGFVLLLVLRD
jgi:apolipoprotein N-acyltransferase